MANSILCPEDEAKLKVLLQYAFADSPTFDGLTRTERAILGDRETYVRIVSWSCEGKANPYVTGEAQHVTAREPETFAQLGAQVFNERIEPGPGGGEEARRQSRPDDVT